MTSAIFDRDLTPVLTRLPLDEELALIAAAQSGQQAAYTALLRQYAHALRGLARTEYSRAGGTVDADETRANVLLAFAEALNECDGTTRIAAKLKSATLRVADEHHLVGAFTIPERTRQRYFQALREAGPDGDPVAKAIELGMTLDTFTAVRLAIGTGSIDYLLGSSKRANEGQYDIHTGGQGLSDSEPSFSTLQTDPGYSTADQRADVARAFAAVDELTAGIIEDGYGFAYYDDDSTPDEPIRERDAYAGFDPIPDVQIAHLRGLSRSSVQRKRTEGLAVMRVALGVTEEATA